MNTYYKCEIKEDAIETSIDYTEGTYLKLGTDLTFSLSALSDEDKDYFIGGMKKLLNDREIYIENKILGEQVQDLRNRVEVLENAHKIRTNHEISKIRNSIDI